MWGWRGTFREGCREGLLGWAVEDSKGNGEVSEIVFEVGQEVGMGDCEMRERRRMLGLNRDALQRESWRRQSQHARRGQRNIPVLPLVIVVFVAIVDSVCR